MSFGIQIQKQDFSQLQKQKQDQVHCNNSLGMLLSSMESLLIKSGHNIPVLFGHYNHFNDISWKTKEEIRAQLYTGLLAYKIQKMAYNKKYHKFDFPDYPPIEKIKQKIKDWKSITINKQDQDLCDEILDLINDSNQKPISFYQGRVESYSTSSHADPIQLFKLSNLLHDQIDMRNEEINKEIEVNPNTEFGLIIGENYGTSEFSHLKTNINMKNKDHKIILLENEIIKNVKELLKKIEIYYRSNELNLYNELQNICINVTNSLKEYYIKVGNIDFLNSNFKMKEEVEKINKYIINTVDQKDKNELFKAIKKMFEEYLNSYR